MIAFSAEEAQPRGPDFKPSMAEEGAAVCTASLGSLGLAASLFAQTEFVTIVAHVSVQ